MKKFFSLLCAMVLVMSASAAPVKLVKADNANLRVLRQVNLTKKADALQKHQMVRLDATKVASLAPARVAAKAQEVFDGVITVENITSTTADVTITPTDNNVTYYWTVWSAEVYDDVVNGAYAQYGINSAEDYLAYELSYYLSQYAAYGYTIDDFVSVGVDTYSFTKFDPETDYVVVAAQVDASGNVIGEVLVENFTTEAAAESENVITITYDDATGTLNITTTNNDPYFFYIETLAGYDEYQSSYLPEAVAAELQDWIETIESIGAYYDVYLEDYVFSGDQSFSLEDFGIEEDGDYIAMAVPYAGMINGEATSCIFNYVAPEVEISKTVNVTIVDSEWDETAFATSGWWQVLGAESTDTLYYVSLSNDYATQIAGTYVKEDMDMSYSYIYDFVDGNGKVSLSDVTVTITADATSPIGYAITAVLVGKNGIQYNLTFTWTPTALKNVDAAAKAAKAIKNGQLVIIKNGVEFNAQGAKL